MRKAFLLLTLLILAFFAFPPVMAFIASAHAEVKDAPISCEYEGRTYASGEQRKAADACNVCTCGAQGWSCTTNACQAGAEEGTISGKLAYPTAPVPAQQVCALNLKDDKTYCQRTLGGETAYAVSVPAGDYWVYATLTNEDDTGRRAYYSQYELCGEKPSCKDHSPVEVTIASKDAAYADPKDWVAGGEVDGLVVSPSKWEFGEHNYYPGSSAFVVTGRKLVSVKLFKTSFPPPHHPDDPPPVTSELGDATPTGTQDGTQSWFLPVPSGMKATTVYAVGTAENGDYMSSRELKLVVPYFDTWGDNATNTPQK